MTTIVNTSNKQLSILEKLPTEMFDHVLSLLNFKDLARLAQTSLSMNEKTIATAIAGVSAKLGKFIRSLKENFSKHVPEMAKYLSNSVDFARISTVEGAKNILELKESLTGFKESIVTALKPLSYSDLNQFHIENPSLVFFDPILTNTLECSKIYSRFLEIWNDQNLQRNEKDKQIQQISKDFEAIGEVETANKITNLIKTPTQRALIRNNGISPNGNEMRFIKKPNNPISNMLSNNPNCNIQ